MSGIYLYYRCTVVNYNAKEVCKIGIAPTKELENAVIYTIKQLNQNSIKWRRAIEIANSEVYNDADNITKLNNTQIELKANHRYMLEGGINTNTSPSLGYCEIQFYSVTDTAYVGIKGTTIQSSNPANSGSNTQAKAILSPTVDITIEMRLFGGDGMTSHNSTVEILEL